MHSLILATGLALVGCGGGDDTAGTTTGTGTGTTGTGTTSISDHPNVDCSTGPCVITGTVTQDLRLVPGNEYLLQGTVFIGDGTATTTLTVDPGVTVYGESATVGTLIIARGSKLMAEGTASAPIVFTSSAVTRARGDWGGVIINGSAPINVCDDGGAGTCEAQGEGETGLFGGNNSTDDSGSLKYVRVEFAGKLYSPENELNGIAFQGVGSGTSVDYIQVHMNSDDGVEFFGGTVSAKHVVLTGIGDDSLDWTDGWTGNLQFVAAQQHCDTSDNGIEADNNGEGNDYLPRSAPKIANLTLIGCPDSSESDNAMLLREGTAGDFMNVYATAFNDACLDVDHDSTFTQADTDKLNLTYSHLNCTSLYKDDSGDGETWDLQGWFEGEMGNGFEDIGLGDGLNVTAPNFKPSAAYDNAGGDPTTLGTWFDSVTFVGAMSSSDDWTAGWTAYPAN